MSLYKLGGKYIKKINKSKARCYLFLIFAGKFSTKNEN
ncbi:hypothetical protein M116_2478 [Bacteroides fragilis str. 3719 A10]|nr:hypothetical protein M116_2478 [Bacteroides fragilis str. 3719 A10]